MRLSELRNAKVRTLDGKPMGRLHEVHCEGGRVVGFTCGAGSWIESLTSKAGGRKVPWERIVNIDDRGIVVSDDPPDNPARKRRTASASRTRPGTRRPSAPRSKR